MLFAHSLNQYTSYIGMYVRITEDEARMLDHPTAQVHKGGGYIVTLDVYHQLHCLNYLRMALEADRYKFPQTTEALGHHIGELESPHVVITQNL